MVANPSQEGKTNPKTQFTERTEVGSVALLGDRLFAMKELVEDALKRQRANYGTRNSFRALVAGSFIKAKP